MDWHFREKRIGDDFSDPISGEFFADGSLQNPATALVREALQNALDAGKHVDRGGEPVHVKLSLHRGSGSLAAESAQAWFGTLRPHLETGLKNPPAAEDPCEYLVVEDFGTSGLTGAIDSDDSDGERNNFVDFLRSDGRTRKDAGDCGSWGVGKNVFPRSSRINGFLAYTVRIDDKQPLAMGKVILRNRRVGEHQYQPPCYFGASWNDDSVPLPLQDDTSIRKLREDFSLTREDEPGLSLIVPWVDADISFDDLLGAVIDQFYFSLLAGGLRVTLAQAGEEVSLDKDTLAGHVNARLPHLVKAVELAAWSLSVQNEDRLVLEPPPADEAQKWSPDLVTDETRVVIAQALTQRERIAVRIPVHVLPPDTGTPTTTHFDIYLEQHDEPRMLRPGFFREQLAISGVKRAVGASSIRSLVVIEKGPLADLLRSAEPPNHTDWDRKTANFQQNYVGSSHVITYVKEAVKRLIGIVRAGDDEPDLNVTIDFFALPEPDALPGSKKKKKGKPGSNPDEPPDPPPPKKKRFTITDIDGGFVIRPGEQGTSPPKRLHVAMAYDVLDKSPWKQYEAADFDLTRKDRSGIQIVTKGDADYEVTDPNRFQIVLPGGEFEVYVNGFDSNRDLIVRAYDPKEPIDVDPATELHETQTADA